MTAAREHETIFTLEATPIKFGPGAAADAGWELKRLGVKRALLVTDPGVAAIGHPERDPREHRGRGHRGRRLRPRPRRADARLLPGGRRLRP